MNFKDRARKLKQDVPAVFLALQRKETPWAAKILAGLTVAYALSPVDFIPDFIPVLGYLDDVILLPVMVAITVKLIPASVLAECREQAAELWKDGKPKKYLESFLDITPGSVSILGLMNDLDHRVRLLVDREVLEEEFFACHPCINTSSLKLHTAEVFGTFLKEVRHDATVLDLGEEYINAPISLF